MGCIVWIDSRCYFARSAWQNLYVKNFLVRLCHVLSHVHIILHQNLRLLSFQSVERYGQRRILYHFGRWHLGSVRSELYGRWVLSLEFRCRLLLIFCHVHVAFSRGRSLAVLIYFLCDSQRRRGFLNLRALRYYEWRNNLQDYKLVSCLRAYLNLIWTWHRILRICKLGFVRNAKARCFRRLNVACEGLLLVFVLGDLMSALSTGGKVGWRFKTVIHRKAFMLLCIYVLLV